MMTIGKFQMTKQGFLFLVMAWTALLLWGCTINSATIGNRLSLPLDSDIKTFNPVLVSDSYSQTVLGLVFNGLLTTDGAGQLIPDLAEKWEFRQGGKQVIFTLRKNLRWSDGQPLTIADVLFSFQDIYFNEKIPSSAQDIFRIGNQRLLPRVAQLNDRSIVFTLPDQFAPFVRFAGGASILPKHLLEKSVKTLDKSGKPLFLETWGISTPITEVVGSGLYRLQSYRPSERILYDRNPYYWDTPKPNIARLVYQIISSPDSVVLKFRSKELDVIPGVRGQDFQLLKRFEKRDGFTIYPLGGASGRSFMLFNLNQGSENGKPFVDPYKSQWFNNVDFRRAIAYSIDRQAMINSYYRGLGEPQDSPIPAISPYHFSRSQGVPFYDYNPDRARKLLQQAGFSYNSANRLIDRQGNLVRFELVTSSGGAGTFLGPLIKNDLDRIGITVDFNVLEFTALIDKLDRSKQWDAAMLGFGGGIEPHSSFHLWYSQGASHLFNQASEPGKPTYAGRTIADWEKQIDDLIIAGAKEIDEQKRRAIYGKFQKVVQTNLPLIYLVTPLAMSAVRDRLLGLQATPAGGVLWNLEDLSLAASQK